MKNLLDDNFTSVPMLNWLQPAGVNWMSKQKTDAATILDSSACNARCKLSKILLWYTAFVNFDKNAHFAQAKVFKIVTMRPFIYYVSKTGWI